MLQGRRARTSNRLHIRSRSVDAVLRCAAVARPLLLLAVLLFALVSSASSVWAGSARSANGHLVRWDTGLEEMGRRAVRQIPVIDKQVEAALGFPLRGGPAEVAIVRGHARMQAEAGVPVPEWAGGVFLTSRSLIVVRADRVEGFGLLRSMVTTLRHEWVHLAWSRRAGEQRRRLPLWVEEGLAEEIGGGITVDGGAQLDFAATFGRLIPFDDIAKTWPVEAGRAALAYRQGRSFVQFFRDRSGWDHLQRILASLADGGGVSDSLAAGTPFEEVVQEVSGLPLSHWTGLWRVRTEEEADPWFKLLLRDFMGAVFFAIALIALVAFFFIRRKRKREIAALPDHPLPF